MLVLNQCRLFADKLTPYPLPPPPPQAWETKPLSRCRRKGRGVVCPTLSPYPFPPPPSLIKFGRTLYTRSKQFPPPPAPKNSYISDTDCYQIKLLSPPSVQTFPPPPRCSHLYAFRTSNKKKTLCYPRLSRSGFPIPRSISTLQRVSKENRSVEETPCDKAEFREIKHGRKLIKKKKVFSPQMGPGTLRAQPKP